MTSVLPGCKGKQGAAGADASAAAADASLPPPDGPLEVIEVKPSGDVIPDDVHAIFIETSTRLAEPLQLAIEPPVKGVPELCSSYEGYAEGRGGRTYCQVVLEPQTTYTVTMAASQTDVHGQVLGEVWTHTFKTLDARPEVSMQTGQYAAELTRGAYPLFVRNVATIEVLAARVPPSRLGKLVRMINWWDSDRTRLGEARVDYVKRTLKVDAPRNEWTQIALDPEELFGKPARGGIYYFEVASPDVPEDRWPQLQKALVNFTDLGVTSKLAGDDGLVWVTRLSTGEPVDKAKVSVRRQAGGPVWQGTTDQAGLVRTPGLATLAAENDRGLLVHVEHDGDRSFMNPDQTGGLSSWAFNVEGTDNSRKKQLRGFMHSDRGIYRPGETVHLKGLARTMALGGRLEPATDGNIDVAVVDPRGRTVLETTAAVSPFGGFWFDVELPEDTRLGDYNVQATLSSGSFHHSFSVEEYRVAAFEVNAEAERQAAKGNAEVKATVRADYFYGAPARGSRVDWTVHARPRVVTFAGHEDFDFHDTATFDPYYQRSDHGQTYVTEDTGTLDDEGKHTVSFKIDPSALESEVDLLVRASVQDPSNQVITDSLSIPYFRHKTYPGLKLSSTFFETSSKQAVTVMAVGTEGQARRGRVIMKVHKRDYDCTWNSWGWSGSYSCEEKLTRVAEQKLSLTGKPLRVPLSLESAGEYVVSVQGEGTARAAERVYVYGRGTGGWRSDDSQTFDIVTDKKSYLEGDTAMLLLKTPTEGAQALVTVEREGLLEHRTLPITKDTKHIEIPIREGYGPNVYASVVLVTPRTGEGAQGMPRFRMGLVNLPVKVQGERLAVAVKTDRAAYEPGEEVTAQITVRDPSGQPARAEVSVTAADEGVLSLIGYETPDPVATFYAPWALGVATATLYERVLQLAGPDQERPTTGGGLRAWHHAIALPVHGGLETRALSPTTAAS